MANSIIPIALFVAFLWGVQPIIHKYVIKTIDPKTIMVVGGVFYTACLALYGLYHRRTIQQDAGNLSATLILVIGMTSILTAFFANLLYFHIIKKHESYVVSALIYCSPIFTLLLAYFVLHERVTTIGTIGVAFIIAGVVLIGFHEHSVATDGFVALTQE